MSWLPSSRFDIRALVAAQHGWISSSSVCVDPQGIAFLEDAHYRPPVPPFTDDGGLCRDSHNGLHSFQSRCSTCSSHCETIVCCPGALTVRVNVLSVHLKSDLYLDGIWVACVASPSVRSRGLVDLKQRLAACVQSEHTPTDTAPVPVHFRFLFGTPFAPPTTSVRLSKSHSSCIRGSSWPVVTHSATLCATPHCAWH